MKKYFSCFNNGVTAIVSEEVYNDIQRHNTIWQNFAEREKEVEYKDRYRSDLASEATFHLTTPTFTFTRVERFSESPWFTGDMYDLNEVIKFIEENGGVVEHSGFYVPFSNAAEIGLHGKQAMRGDLVHVTNSQQFRETFGISLPEIKERARLFLAHVRKTDEIVRGANTQVFGDSTAVR